MPGAKIQSPKDIVNLEYEYIVLAVYNANNARAINQELLEYGVDQNKIVWIGEERKVFKGNLLEQRLLGPTKWTLSSFLLKNGADSGSKEVKKYIENTVDKNRVNRGLIIPRVVVVLSSVCTLTCKYCSNLMPLYEKPKHIPKEVVLSDIEKLMEYADGIISLELIGGEPFAYPELEAVLRKVISYDKVMNIEITTNGTIKPKAEIVELLKSSKVLVNVSVYDKIENRIIGTLLTNGIRFVERSDDNAQWCDAVHTENINRNERQSTLVYSNCWSGYVCKTLLKGRLYQCGVSSSLYDLGICMNSKGFIDIYQDCSKEKIKEFLLMTYNPGCDFCSPDLWRVVPAGEQLTSR